MLQQFHSISLYFTLFLSISLSYFTYYVYLYIFLSVIYCISLCVSISNTNSLSYTVCPFYGYLTRYMIFQGQFNGSKKCVKMTLDCLKMTLNWIFLSFGTNKLHRLVSPTKSHNLHSSLGFDTTNIFS